MTNGPHTSQKMVSECVNDTFIRDLANPSRGGFACGGVCIEANYSRRILRLARRLACDNCAEAPIPLASVGMRVNTEREMPLRALATPAGATPPNLAREPWLTFSVPATTTSRSARPATFPPSVSRASFVKRSARRTSCAPSGTCGRSDGWRLPDRCATHQRPNINWRSGQSCGPLMTIAYGRCHIILKRASPARSTHISPCSAESTLHDPSAIGSIVYSLIGSPSRTTVRQLGGTLSALFFIFTSFHCRLSLLYHRFHQTMRRECGPKDPSEYWHWLPLEVTW